MKLLVLYLLLLKATITSFAGLASLPVIRQDLVVDRHALTAEELDVAVAVSRITPGPAGGYVVSVGYSVAGTAGAVVGWLAMCTPALVVVPLLQSASGYIHNRRVRRITRAVVAASSGLLLAAAVPLAHESLTGPVPIAIAAVALAVLLLTKIDSCWVIVTASLAGLVQLL